MAIDFPAARAAAVAILEAALGAEVQVVVSPDQVTPPCLLLGNPTVTYQGGAQGMDKADWPLFAILARTHDVAAVNLVDQWVSRDGALSVRRILMEDQTWGGTISGVFIRTAVAEIYDGPSGQLPDYHWEMEVYG